MVKCLTASIVLLSFLSVCQADEFDALRDRFESVELEASTALVTTEALQRQVNAALDLIADLEARVEALETPTPGEYDLVADENLSLAEAVKAAKAGDKIGVKGSHAPFLPKHVKPGITIEGMDGAVIVGGPTDWQAVRLQGDNCRDVTIRNLDVDARNCRPRRGVTGIKITIDSSGEPATGIVLEDVAILGVSDAIDGQGVNHSLGLLCDSGADVTWRGGSVEDVGSYGVYANSLTRLKDLTIESPRWGVHFYHEGGNLTGSEVVNCNVWESEGIIAFRNKGLIQGCKAKLIVVGGSSRGWTVTRNTVKQIKAPPGTQTILSTTEGVVDDNEYQSQ